ncbi:aspartate kinase [Seinonella peptonophila]|uniref:Aspartokinase n=1 Tax=Seinonella peptonophila TaxID=112248 RepID=A0A1M5AQP4_9BACL|nr:aspartate kinase [Seinonella peptonophila]SHF32563.1 aspartate kinase [Seinonella peptonophila]
MNILVQKFGGTSVASDEMREHVVHHIRRELASGYRIVVVVSAMGRSGDPYATDTLLSMVGGEKANLSSRELDLLVSCGEVISASKLASLLKSYGIDSCVMTGGQAGIVTDNRFMDARILAIHPNQIEAELELGKVVVVAGFQGQTAKGEVTTLGRGGSDTTATALGVALHAERVDIYTDVEGIMTADPRIVADAAPLEMVTYTEMCNLAFQGAKVIHPRAVEIAMQTNVPIRVRSTFSDHPGTLVVSTPEQHTFASEVQERLITGITQRDQVTQIRVATKDGNYDIQRKVFRAMADQGISVDFISVNPSGIAYTVYDEYADHAEMILRSLDLEPELRRHCAKVSTVGAGIAGVPGVMAQILEALTEEDIQILQSADSHTTIWVLVRGEDMIRSVQALHRHFQLHQANKFSEELGGIACSGA